MTTQRMDLFGNKNNVRLMNKELLLEIFSILDKHLKENNLYLELHVYGGTVMNLLYDCRPATRDIDCVFNSSNEKLLNHILDNIKFLFGLGDDWLNTEVAIPLANIKQERMEEFSQYSNLKIMLPEKEQLLAMKLLASRPEPAKDFIDAELLCRDLGIVSKEELLGIFYKYFSPSLIGERQVQFIKYLGEDLGYDWK